MIATKLQPKLWKRSKEKACTVAKLCKHSARKMQWATRYYKDHGGQYKSPRRSANNKLVKWTKQKWRTHSGKPSKGTRRYLPSKAWEGLSPSQIRRTNDAKRRGFRHGKQYVRQPSDVQAAVRKYRSE